ncbi:MAG: hypothetical protein CXT73_00745 [Methanobacteriota archaeon]|jgi:hypothetical protein|nr:MAG: hypothetical protein CXT73_00745 [Euryarchaeota archaeon]
MALNELLSNFLKIYNLTEYKVIRTTSDAWVEHPRIIVFDEKNNYYYKIFSNITKEIKKYDHVFLNNAYFSSHLVTSVIKENMWIVKQSVPTGTLLTDIFRNKNIVDDKIIDSILANLVWVKNETQRIFPSLPKNKLWDFSGGDLCASNLIYNTQTNNIINIDIEHSQWVTKDEYLTYAFKRLTKHLWKWSQIPGCNFLPILKMPKILDKCMMFIDKEIL